MRRSRDGDNKFDRLIVGVKDVGGVFSGSYISKALYGQKVRSAGNKFVIYSTTPPAGANVPPRVPENIKARLEANFCALVASK